MMMCMNEADYESQRDEIHCGGYEEPNQGGEYGSPQRPSTTAAGGRWTSPK